MKTLIVVIVLLAVIGLFFVNTYISSPGFVTPEMAEEFAATAPKCYGFSYLMNPEEMAADAPGKSLCVGYLKK